MRFTMLVEAGERYEELRGVELVGKAVIIEDPEQLWKFGVSLWERYYGPFTEQARPLVENMLRKRVLVTIDVDKVVSWDHRKLASLGSL
jgi:hypothetical protein